MRRLALLAAVTVLLALASGCSVPRLSPRTTPDEVEQAAVANAQHPAKRDGVPIADDIWTQLWTPTQAAAQIKNCVYQGSGGVLEFQAAPLVDQADGLSYQIGAGADISALSALGDFTDQRAVGRLVDSCIAAYPIDGRLWLVPEEDRDELYSYDLTVLRRCLLAHGQAVARMPDRARFDALSRAGSPWNAYEEVVVTNRGAWYALSDACPALPSDLAAHVTALRASS